MAVAVAGALPADVAPGRRDVSRSHAVRRFKWVILTPLLLMLFGLLTPVLLLQLYFSFHQWTIYLSSWWNADFVGFDIFGSVLTDPRFGWALLRSLVFAGGSTIGCFVFGFLLAYLIYRPFRGQALYYALFILPMLTVPIVIAYTGQMLLDRNGPLNDILSLLSRHEVRVLWLSDPNIALPTVTLLDIWNWTPFSFIIMLAGLSSLPKEPVEAAQILGASSWRIFWEVQLPLLRPVILLALVLRFLDAMGAFPIIWALLQGGPGTATETLGIYIYITTWQDFNVSLGAAQSYITMVMMVVIVLAGIRLLRKEKRSFELDVRKAARSGRRMTRTKKRYVASTTRYVILTVWAVMVAFPLYWMITTSFKPSDQWFSWPPVWFPSPPTFENYSDVWLGTTDVAAGGQYAMEMQTPFLALRNSLMLAFGATALAVLYGSIIAYAVSRYRLLSETRMFQLLMLRMVPPIVIVAPLSLYYSYIGLLDSMIGLGVLYLLSSLPYAVWMTKSFIDEVPREVEQAAEILGASRWRTIFEVVLPLIRSGLVATFMFILILNWSEYLLALILSKTHVVTLPVELSKYEGSTEGRLFGRQAALSVGITVPLMVVGLLIRKHLARGFSFGMVRR